MEISNGVKIITISGLDGSGKSTQVEMLKNYLAGLGKKVFYFHAVQFGIANKILKSRGSASTETRSAKPRSEPGSATGVTKAGWLKMQLRKIALSIDLLRFRLLCNKLRSSGYDYILSDRYFYDSWVNIAYLNLKSGARLLEKELSFSRILKPDLAIYLNADPEIIMRRERQPDQGIKYLIAKKEIFDKKFKKWDLKLIDGNRSKEIIFSELRELTDKL